MEKKSMKAYPDSKCCYGYMTICDDCTPKAPSWVDISKPITNPPAVLKEQRCEICGKRFVLSNPSMKE